MTSDYAIEASGLRKHFGATKALDGVDLHARRGSVLGVLGPNGAGKTTAVGRLLDFGAREARARARELLDWFDLSEAAERTAKTYSGGMRRRLDLAASLVGRPEVIFLDEPTTGLDPSKRKDMWGVIRSLVAEGSTVLLTTQYLEEAERSPTRSRCSTTGASSPATHPTA